MSIFETLFVILIAAGTILYGVYFVGCAIEGRKYRLMWAPFEVYVRETGGRLYYAVESYKSTGNSLTQRLSFHMFRNNILINVTASVNIACNYPKFGKVKNRKGNLYWEITDYDMIKLTKELKKVIPNLQLMRIDKELVNV